MYAEEMICLRNPVGNSAGRRETLSGAVLPVLQPTPLPSYTGTWEWQRQ